MTYSSDLRQKVLEKLEQGYSIRQTAKLFGIHFTTVRNWKKQPLPTTPKPPQVRPPKKISRWCPEKCADKNKQTKSSENRVYLNV